jgi:hypothetical protein
MLVQPGDAFEVLWLGERLRLEAAHPVGAGHRPISLPVTTR